MRPLRSIAGMTQLLLLLLAAMVDLALRQLSHDGPMPLIDRARWMQRWCRRGLRLLRVEVDAQGTPPEAGVVVSNHLSYLDILLFAAARPCIFIAKSEIRRWPLLGWLAQGGGTLFIDRSQRAFAQTVGAQMLQVLDQGVSIVFFPEGTTTQGNEVLRFHSSLFEYAVQGQVPVTPACVGYVADDASVPGEVCYWGDMVLVPHLWRLTAIPRITGSVVYATDSSTYTDRRTAAVATHDAVAQMRTALQQRLPDHSARTVEERAAEEPYPAPGQMARHA